MPGKVNVIKVIYQVLGWLDIAVGVLAGLALIIVGSVASLGGREAAVAGLLAGVATGIIVLVVCVALGVVHLIIAQGIGKRKEWARIMAIIFAILMLWSFPIGTALGVVILVNVFSDEVKAWFTG